MRRFYGLLTLATGGTPVAFPRKRSARGVRGTLEQSVPLTAKLLGLQLCKIVRSPLRGDQRRGDAQVCY